MPIVTTSTCEGARSFAVGEEYAFGSSGVKFVFLLRLQCGLNFSIGEVEVRSRLSLKMARELAVVFGGDLGVVVGFGDFKAGFGDEESDIGDLPMVPSLRLKMERVRMMLPSWMVWVGIPLRLMLVIPSWVRVLSSLASLMPFWLRSCQTRI
jgi:hypothetical protein